MSNNDEFIHGIARAFFVYVLGCTLITDKMSGFIQVFIINLFMNLNRVNKYVWVIGTLGCLYRLLDASSQHGSLYYCIVL